jgi:hypothetical protein
LPEGPSLVLHLQGRAGFSHLGIGRVRGSRPRARAASPRAGKNQNADRSSFRSD